MLGGLDPGQLEGLPETLAGLQQHLGDQALLLGQYTATQTVAYLRSLTDQTAPPIRRGDPPRRRHPGYWADRSGQLAAAYHGEARRVGNDVDIEWTNPTAYAQALEARDGYMVLSGITDRGGPVEKVIREGILTLGLGIEVQSYD